MVHPGRINDLSSEFSMALNINGWLPPEESSAGSYKPLSLSSGGHAKIDVHKSCSTNTPKSFLKCSNSSLSSREDTEECLVKLGFCKSPYQEKTACTKVINSAVSASILCEEEDRRPVSNKHMQNLASSKSTSDAVQTLSELEDDSDTIRSSSFSSTSLVTLSAEESSSHNTSTQPRNIFKRVSGALQEYSKQKAIKRVDRTVSTLNERDLAMLQRVLEEREERRSKVRYFRSRRPRNYHPALHNVSETSCLRDWQLCRSRWTMEEEAAWVKTRVLEKRLHTSYARYNAGLQFQAAALQKKSH